MRARQAPLGLLAVSDEGLPAGLLAGPVDPPQGPSGTYPARWAGSVMKEREVRIYINRFDECCKAQQLTHIEATVFRRLLERAGWRPTDRGMLTTRLTELIDPYLERHAVARAVRRLSELGLIEMVTEFGRGRSGQPGMLVIPLSIYEHLVPVTKPADRPPKEPQWNPNGTSKEEMCHWDRPSVGIAATPREQLTENNVSVRARKASEAASTSDPDDPGRPF